ncbi:hypothetical protein DPMN_085167 [Dreissena polymorpha]|uniref:Uncharacterized protein n=1 Tax=Dreissena polymorpha TaxID=45954 RepID=A0A9D3YD58_DREPO|nr:hypothetical protein DPMN_085167 [Dreissena polymorpha]
MDLSTCATSEVPDQTAHLLSLVCSHADRYKVTQGFVVPSSDSEARDQPVR